MVSRFKPRSKKPIGRKSYSKYLKRKYDYVKCSWCNRVIRKDSYYCQWCSEPNLDYPYPDQMDKSWRESVHFLIENLSKPIRDFVNLYLEPLGLAEIPSTAEPVHLLNEELSKLVNHFATLYHVPLGFTKTSSDEGNQNPHFPSDVRQISAQEMELRRFIEALASIVNCIQKSEKLETVTYKFKYSKDYEYRGEQITFDFNKS
ncbi:hypothetical protein NXK88_001949 [Enterococcus hirae]|uniref:hypothetical protein n=1 Tax=Enterococcus hirae TaxID=1354 RepID=UPI002073844E|nr:hypothetical protein [Enterococcus hirae]EMF0202718.1 hypothetical protein [Enterococcus hirae]